MAELNKLQKETLDLFAKSSLAKSFYWTGGTLLSTVYLHHRTSEDLDFFSDKPFNPEELRNFAENLKKRLKLKGITAKKVFDRWEFLITNKEKVRVEFVLYEHPKLKPRKKWQGIFIDSLDDIAANKTMAMFDRNDPKDIFDLYFLITQKYCSVKNLLQGTRKKFGLKVDEDSFWSATMKALRNLDNLEPLMLAKNQKTKKELNNSIRDYFKSHSLAYLRHVLK